MTAKCSSKGCPREPVVGFKTCQLCRDRYARYRKGAKRKAVVRKYEASDKGKLVTHRKNVSAKGKARAKRFYEAHKEEIAAYSKQHRAKPETQQREAAYRQSEKGQATRKKAVKAYNAKITTKIRQRLVELTTNGKASNTATKWTGFQAENDARLHFESTFEPWMTWDNYGLHRRGNDYKVLWQIGHRIPCAAYDADDPEELKKCMHPLNLFAQCSRENNENNAKIDAMPKGDALLALKAIWPKGWF